MMDKKGELTSKQLVTIIILIVSFGVILIFLFALNLNSDIERETCRNSVLLRGTPLGGSTQLNCKTQDVCISAGGKCKESLSDTVQIKANDKEEILDELSNLIYDCHWQMGEGKISFAPDNYGADRNYCVICNRIYFDEKIKSNEDLNSVTNKEFYSYLKDKKAPNGEDNLLFTLYRVNSIDSAFTQLSKSEELEKSGLNLGDLPIRFDLDSGYALVTYERKEGWGGVALAAGTGLLVGASIVLIPVTGGASLVVAGAIITASTATGAAVGFAVSGPGGDGAYSPPALYPNQEKVLNGLNCYEFSTLS